jgi:hypothetical protein
MTTSAAYNTKHIIPSQYYYNWLMKKADDCYWRDDKEAGQRFERDAVPVKEAIERGEKWYPLF